MCTCMQSLEVLVFYRFLELNTPKFDLQDFLHKNEFG
jgi:hypothetical protein